MKCKGLKTACVGAVVVCGLSANAATTTYNFNDLSGWQAHNSTWTEHGGKAYYKSWRAGIVSYNGTKSVRLTSKILTTGSAPTAQGALLTSNASYASPSTISARCVVAGGGDYAHSWAAFWTLYDKVKSSNNKNAYIENDIMETAPNGNYFNRYYGWSDTNKSNILGTQKMQSGSFWWRKYWEDYKCKYTATSSEYSVNNPAGKLLRYVKVTGPSRAQKQQVFLQNRPWMTTLKTKNTSIEGKFIKNMYCDWVKVVHP